MQSAPTHFSNPKAPRVKSRRIGVLRALFPFLRPYKMLLVTAIAALLLTVALTLIAPVFVRHVVDNFQSDGAEVIEKYLMAALVGAGALAAVTALRFLLIAQLGERVVTDLRTAVFDRVIELSPVFFEKTVTSEVVSRITTDTTLIQTIVGSTLLMALRHILTVAGGVMFMFFVSAKLAILLVFAAPFVVLPVLFLGLRIRTISREAQAWVAALAGKASEELSAVQTVQAFSHETASRRDFSRMAQASFAAARSRVRYSAILTFAVMFLIFAAVVVTLWIGAGDVKAGKMSPGALAQFMIYAVMVAGAAAGLAQIWGHVQRAAGATERLVELLGAQDTICDPVNSTRLPQPVQGHIGFADVEFSYQSGADTAALGGISFEVLSGETVALVGPSGAGKTTIIQLIQRFYDPIAGRITLDGIDLRDLTRSDFRGAMALVPQDPVIFAATAADNIRFGRTDANESDIIDAATVAAADGFISALPNGYHSYLGERGVILSGGQKQRIALARAILRDAPILLLDEATSALDAQSERTVQNAIDHLRQNRTTLVVAHRLATVKKADRIIVLDKGQIVATGTHETLVAEGGLYSDLARLQFTADTPS